MGNAITFTAALAPPVMATMADGTLYTFERATPRILAELGAWHRAQTSEQGTGRGWTTIEDAVRLANTIEGMEWLAWRCACAHHPEVKARGPQAFRAATNDFALLSSLVAELTDYPDPEKLRAEGNAAPPEEAASSAP